jgi:hypothetical protein
MVPGQEAPDGPVLETEHHSEPLLRATLVMRGFGTNSTDRGRLPVSGALTVRWKKVLVERPFDRTVMVMSQPAGASLYQVVVA